VLFRSRSGHVYGPYESCPRNPILSQRGRPTHPIQATGHADLVQAHDNSWWLVFLGIRQTGWGEHHLGRETFLAPVKWDKDGWPVVNNGELIELKMTADGLPAHPWDPMPVRDDFDRDKLGLQWNFRRNPDERAWSLTEKKGSLTLHCISPTLNEKTSLAFIGRRQQHAECEMTAKMRFDPRCENDEAGISVMMRENHHYDMAIRKEGANNLLILKKYIGDISETAARMPAPEGYIYLRVTATNDTYRFSYSRNGTDYTCIGEGQTRYLSSEVATGFTGVYFGMYATGNGRDSLTPVYFDWFEYHPAQDV
jgi:xylan 1,4-beta-xylosidase